MAPEVRRRLEDPAEVRRREAAVLSAARIIGIDIATEKHLLWIAEFASEAKLPPDWKWFQTDEGETAYYHPDRKYSTRKHHRDHIRRLSTRLCLQCKNSAVRKNASQSCRFIAIVLFRPSV